MSDIRLARDLSLPLDVVTQKIAILAVSGAGKTYTGKLIAEELLEHGQWPIIIDPVGVWWGLRSSADGKTSGYPILILGGEHGDIPLDSGAGQVVANFLIDETMPAILDISEWSNRQQTKFLTELCNELYRLKKPTQPPLMLMLDEADQYAPQKPMPGEQELLGAWERIVRRGRAKGLGFTMITQRGAVLNKNVLTQIETLIALRNTSPQDSAAIRAWVEQHGTPERTKELLSSLPTLENGHGWIWSPFWLKIFQRVHFRKARTFDSSATPKPGQTRIAPRKVAEIDLGKLQEAFASAIEQKTANDPVALRKRIAELERDQKSAPVPNPAAIEERYKAGYQEGYKAGTLTENQRLGDEIETVKWTITEALTKLSEAVPPIFEAEPGNVIVMRREVRKSHAPQRDSANNTNVAKSARSSTKQPLNGASVADGDLKKYDLRLLETLVERHPMRLTRSQLATLSGSSPKSSSFDLALKRLRDGGWMQTEGGRFEASEQAFARLGPPPGLPKSREALLEMWKQKLPGYAGSILAELFRSGYPHTREQIAESIGRSPTSSSFDLALKLLRDNHLIESERGSYMLGSVFNA